MNKNDKLKNIIMEFNKKQKNYINTIYKFCQVEICFGYENVNDFIQAIIDACYEDKEYKLGMIQTFKEEKKIIQVLTLTAKNVWKDKNIKSNYF